MSKQVTINNTLSTLLPNGVYGIKFKRQLLSTLEGYKDIDKPAIFEDVIQDNLINVWCVEKSDVDKIKKAHAPDNVVHHCSHFLESILKNPEDGIYLSPEGKVAYIGVVKNKKLQLFKRHGFLSKEDVLYYIMLYQDQYKFKENIFLSESYSIQTRNFVSKHLGKISLLKELKYKKIKGNTISCELSELCE